MFGYSNNQHQTQKKIDYPIRFSYISKITNWWPPQKIAVSLGVPGYADYHMYNYIAFSFWTCQNGPLDIVLLWSDPMKFFGEGNPFGKTKDEVQKFIKNKYNQQGIKLMISAFGATEFPTTLGFNPTDSAIKLAKFVSQNNLDGVDIDWEDNHSMQAGTGQQWLIIFTKKLRQLLPYHIISHAPQAPYFCQQKYKNGGYFAVNKQVGHLIDFYNVQFYNQGNTSYDTYDKLFVNSGGYFNGTSVKQICCKGVDLNKIVVGKPVTTGDATGTGWMDPGVLAQSFKRAQLEGTWHTGVMLWQYCSDTGGQTIKTVISQLKKICDNGKYK